MSISTIFFTMAYNAENTIGRTIDSILNQTRGDFEYYILDNASTDNTEDIIREYAKIDKRVRLIYVNKNDVANGSAFFWTLCFATNAKYMAWCDADDEYTSDFLENMIAFVEENRLDIASCGHDMIDGITGKIIKHRSLDENLVISGDLFTKEFIRYRGFTMYLWGVLYPISFLKLKLASGKLTGTIKKYFYLSESAFILSLFKKAERAGVYGKAMYKYYRYTNSLSSQNIEYLLVDYTNYWNYVKHYLKSYGTISKINEDFLYAIHLSLVEESVDKIFLSKMSANKKLNLLAQIFSDRVWIKTLTRDADPQFRNLAARQEYVDDVANRILALDGVSEKTVRKVLTRLKYNGPTK